MIQELLGGGAAVEERKMSVTGGLIVSDGPSNSCSSPSSSSATSSSPSSTASEHQNLRCPRCDSPNTKFCYYNNYNLTQPRHFCKTCRRYWTKGGALRNVPIGGGCRKTKSTGISVGTTSKSGGGKAKPAVGSVDVGVGKSNLGGDGGGGFDHELPSNPILWTSPQNSHLLALLRATQSSNININCSPSHNPNPNPNTSLNPFRIKGEGPIIGSHLVPEASLLTNAFNARNLQGLDPLDQVSLGLCSSLWRSSHYQQQQQQQHNSMVLCEMPSSGSQEIYQRIRPSTNYYADQSPLVLGNVGSCYSSSSSSSYLSTTATSTTTGTILEPIPVGGGELGYWNSPFSTWTDMPTANGAFP